MVVVTVPNTGNHESFSLAQVTTIVRAGKRIGSTEASDLATNRGGCCHTRADVRAVPAGYPQT
ncbi:MAG TPA: hypothetical protein VF355_04880, partial [Anaerolineaceae bacterium]